jgi:ferredoxin
LGVKVTEHRHRLLGDPDPELKGDALVVAFPTIAWSSPWTLLEYLLFRLPHGSGKPAFIIYTAGGGPENTHLFPWLILSFKGYRVMGRMWAIYPLNVALIRIGTAGVWRFLDGLLPRNGDVKLLERSAAAFCKGEPSGMPFIIRPFFIAALAPLYYNRLVNRIYMTYAFKKRCNHCGRCVNYCPTKRLSLDEHGLLHAKGTCVMCFGCVNECPTNAAQLLCLSEPGRPYRSRRRKFIYRRKSDDRAHA